jgi:hypothetical protein
MESFEDGQSCIFLNDLSWNTSSKKTFFITQYRRRGTFDAYLAHELPSSFYSRYGRNAKQWTHYSRLRSNKLEMGGGGFFVVLSQVLIGSERIRLDKNGERVMVNTVFIVDSFGKFPLNGLYFGLL